ncbi:MAG: hypothetical protein PF630_02880 [Gammaproteobacteria bacterium]|jgi:hypothetical protein|nr:hypothetical protein [Gammaproteobacteria bacterium]
MNSNKLKLIILVVIVSTQLIACSSVESPKLLYGSRKTVGIQLDRGVDGSPVPSINVGYADHDIALVPVAVVYNADATDKQNIELIWGRSCEHNGDNNKTCSNDIESGQYEFKVNLKEASDSYQSAGFEIEPNDISKALSEITSTYALSNDTVYFSSSLSKEELSDRMISNLGNSDGADAQKKLAAVLHKSIKDANALIREDAFSVFGSFTGDVDADKEGVGLAVGKIFATGVAAQTISRGSADALRNQSSNHCLMIIRELNKQNISLSADNLVKLCDPGETGVNKKAAEQPESDS